MRTLKMKRAELTRAVLNWLGMFGALRPGDEVTAVRIYADGRVEVDVDGE